MPKVGMEPLRRAALVKATIHEIGRAQSLDVTVGQIARTAGMSSALAHHYFGGKTQIFLAAMRHILGQYGVEIRRALAQTDGPRARADAIITTSFADPFFEPATVAAWMTLYASANTNPETRQLLSVYHRRLRSNLVHALRPLTARPTQHAETLAALIDGLYLRAALSEDGSTEMAKQSALDTLDLILKEAA
ncbi:transcriptional regulator BetI [uncultured Sulfitobacter sp.]|uniref:choline-binding transcriptional repressor BetI n=1 Tax=uncultured Sulfitobacter sp. TaxID=191468 RepID=UPI002615BA8A|nr:transcriptional regulator BetI [uncultured Sulfitobacter sp.]